jgi:hypothetical protein
LQNKQIEVKKAELQEFEGEILKQKKEIQKRLEVAANSAKKLLQVPDVRPEPSSSTSKQPAISKPTSRLPSLSSQQRKKRRQNFFYENCSSPKIPFTTSTLSNQQEFLAQHQQLPTLQQQVPLDSSAMHTIQPQTRGSYSHVDLYLGAAQQQNFSRSDLKMQMMHLYYQEKLSESSVREFEQMLNKFN